MKKMTLNKTLVLLCLLMASFSSIFASYPGAGTFTKVTTTDDLEDGAYYVLVGSNTVDEVDYSGALSNSISGGRFSATDVTVSSDEITDPDATIVWRLDANSSNWNLYNEAGSVYCEITTSSTSGFAANETASSSFVASVADGNFTFQDATLSRVIAIYKTDFRPYTTGNTLYLYKMQTSTSSVATPSITPSSKTVYGDDLTVSISTYGTDTTVYYTTDGSTPTSSSTAYTAAFTVSSTTTVKAKAIVGTSGDESNLAAATYTFATEVSDIAAFLSANSTATTDLYKITGTVTVTYKNGSRLFVKDDSGALLIYGSSDTFTNGETLTGIYGTYTSYYGTHEFIPDSIPAAVSGTEVSATVMTIPSITTDDQSAYVKLETVRVDTTNKAFALGTDSIPYNDSFGVMSDTYDSSTDYYVLGIVSVYNSAPSFYPIAVSTDPNPTTSVTESVVESSVFAGKGFVNVSLTEEATINVYSLNGYKAASLKGTEGANTIALAKGVYVVTVGSYATKVIVK